MRVLCHACSRPCTSRPRFHAYMRLGGVGKSVGASSVIAHRASTAASQDSLHAGAYRMPWQLAGTCKSMGPVWAWVGFWVVLVVWWHAGPSRTRVHAHRRACGHHKCPHRTQPRPHKALKQHNVPRGRVLRRLCKPDRAGGSAACHDGSAVCWWWWFSGGTDLVDVSTWQDKSVQQS